MNYFINAGYDHRYIDKVLAMTTGLWATVNDMKTDAGIININVNSFLGFCNFFSWVFEDSYFFGKVLAYLV